MSPQAFAVRKKRIQALLAKLKELFPDEDHTILRYGSEWELLVAVQLSAQCTDEMVNRITDKLFKKYRTIGDYAQVTHAELAEDIRSSGYFNNKARNIIAAAKVVEERFGGQLPRTMEEMLEIPGVARKTANVVLGNAFGIVEGIAVDTHVMRFAKRFDLSDAREAGGIERDLMALLPQDEWYLFTYRVIAYGRTIGPAKGYDPNQDPLAAIYRPHL
ncbi:endonuclease III [Patescibacteria group bacterium]|jgi:endonuclease-3|nr:endonuclease III [Patescibacteria group bacterium]